MGEVLSSGDLRKFSYNAVRDALLTISELERCSIEDSRLSEYAEVVSSYSADVSAEHIYSSSLEPLRESLLSNALAEATSVNAETHALIHLLSALCASGTLLNLVLLRPGVVPSEHVFSAVRVLHEALSAVSVAKGVVPAAEEVPSLEAMGQLRFLIALVFRSMTALVSKQEAIAQAIELSSLVSLCLTAALDARSYGAGDVGQPCLVFLTEYARQTDSSVLIADLFSLLIDTSMEDSHAFTRRVQLPTGGHCAPASAVILVLAPLVEQASRTSLFTELCIGLTGHKNGFRIICEDLMKMVPSTTGSVAYELVAPVLGGLRSLALLDKKDPMLKKAISGELAPHQYLVLEKTPSPSAVVSSALQCIIGMATVCNDFRSATLSLTSDSVCVCGDLAVNPRMCASCGRRCHKECCARVCPLCNVATIASIVGDGVEQRIASAALLVISSSTYISNHFVHNNQFPTVATVTQRLVKDEQFAAAVGHVVVDPKTVANLIKVLMTVIGTKHIALPAANWAVSSAESAIQKKLGGSAGSETEVAIEGLKTLCSNNPRALVSRSLLNVMDAATKGKRARVLSKICGVIAGHSHIGAVADMYYRSVFYLLTNESVMVAKSAIAVAERALDVHLAYEHAKKAYADMVESQNPTEEAIGANQRLSQLSQSMDESTSPLLTPFQRGIGSTWYSAAGAHLFHGLVLISRQHVEESVRKSATAALKNALGINPSDKYIPIEETRLNLNILKPAASDLPGLLAPTQMTALCLATHFVLTRASSDRLAAVIAVICPSTDALRLLVFACKDFLVPLVAEYVALRSKAISDRLRVVTHSLNAFMAVIDAIDLAGDRHPTLSVIPVLLPLLVHFDSPHADVTSCNTTVIHSVFTILKRLAPHIGQSTEGMSGDHVLVLFRHGMFHARGSASSVVLDSTTSFVTALSLYSGHQAVHSLMTEFIEKLRSSLADKPTAEWFRSLFVAASICATGHTVHEHLDTSGVTLSVMQNQLFSAITELYAILEPRLLAIIKNTKDPLAANALTSLGILVLCKGASMLLSQDTLHAIHGALTCSVTNVVYRALDLLLMAVRFDRLSVRAGRSKDKRDAAAVRAAASNVDAGDEEGAATWSLITHFTSLIKHLQETSSNDSYIMEHCNAITQWTLDRGAALPRDTLPPLIGSAISGGVELDGKVISRHTQAIQGIAQHSKNHPDRVAQTFGEGLIMAVSHWRNHFGDRDPFLPTTEARYASQIYTSLSSSSSRSVNIRKILVPSVLQAFQNTESPYELGAYVYFVCTLPFSHSIESRAFHSDLLKKESVADVGVHEATEHAAGDARPPEGDVCGSLACAALARIGIQALEALFPSLVTPTGKKEGAVMRLGERLSVQRFTANINSILHAFYLRDEGTLVALGKKRVRLV